MSRACARAARSLIEPLEPRQLLSGTTSTGGTILNPSHVVVVMEEDRFANAIGDTANMPYTNQLAGSGLVYTNAHGINTTSQEGQMAYLALYSGSTQGVTDNSFHGPFSGNNLAQVLNNAGLGFVGYAEAMPHDGDTTDQLAADPNNKKYDDLYTRSYNPMAQFTNVGTGVINSQVNKTFASFPTTAAGYAALPAVSFVVPDTLHNTHGSNDTSPYATDPSSYNLLRQDADNFLKSQIDSYLQWAKQNNSLLIVLGDEGDRAHGFTSLATNDITMIVNGSSNLFVPGTDSANVTVYNVLRTLEDMYGVTKLGSSSTAATLDTNAAGQLSGAVTTKASTTTALATSATPSTFGHSVTFTATVTETASGSPTGTVTFFDGSSQLGTGTLNGSGVATFTTSALSVASHSITATYGGDANFASSSSSALTQTVTKAATSTTISSSASPSTYGQSVTFTATITDSTSSTPTGTVTFKDGSATLGTGTLNGSGVATFTTSSLGTGSHSITANYAGDANFASSASSAQSQTVNKASTSTAVVSSANPSGNGQSVTFTATVTDSTPGTPTGTVTFLDGTSVLGTGTLNSSGIATFITASLSVASHSITAQYGGDSNFSASQSAALSQTVNPATNSPTTTVLGSSINPSTSGQSVTFTATVSETASGTPTGTVTFFDGATQIGTGTLNGAGIATYSTTALSVASHSITASYGGDSNFLGSTSSVLTQVVNPASSGPVNDNFASATSVTGSAFTVAGTNVGATKEAGEPATLAGNSGGHSVWWTWTAPSSGTMSADTHGSSFDTLLGVYTGSSVSALTLVAADDDDPAGGTTTSKVTFTAVAGTTYHIVVDGYGGATGNITLSGSLSGAVLNAPPAPTGVTASNNTYTDGVHVSWTAAPTATSYQVYRATTNNSSNASSIAGSVTTTSYTDTTAVAGTTYYYWVKAVNSAGTSGFSSAASGVRAINSGPANDNFANATVITGTSITASGTNVKATKEAGEPATIAGNSGGHSVWWVWTAPSSGTATIDTHGSSFDTLLGVYTGSSVSALTLVAADDDDPAGGTTTSKVTFQAIAGTTYYIAVDGYGGTTGTITLHVSLA